MIIKSKYYETNIKCLSASEHSACSRACTLNGGARLRRFRMEDFGCEQDKECRTEGEVYLPQHVSCGQLDGV